MHHDEIIGVTIDSDGEIVLRTGSGRVRRATEADIAAISRDSVRMLDLVWRGAVQIAA